MGKLENMQLTAMKEKMVEKINQNRLAITAGTVMIMTTGFASAGTLNTSVAPILDDVTLLFTPLLSMILGAIPLIIVLAVASFVIGLLSVILNKIRI